MKIIDTEIDGLWLIESSILEDRRGSFREWFKKDQILEVTGIDFDTAQANVSISNLHTLRGIHFSIAPKGQAKWLTVLSGGIRDVVLDIRPESKTFGKHVSLDLKADDGMSILVDAFLGHSFLSTSDKTVVAYLLSSPYEPDFEYEINPLDPQLNIDWGINSEKFLLSEKDRTAPTLNEVVQSGRLLNTTRKRF